MAFWCMLFMTFLMLVFGMLSSSSCFMGCSCIAPLNPATKSGMFILTESMALYMTTLPRFLDESIEKSMEFSPYSFGCHKPLV